MIKKAYHFLKTIIRHFFLAKASRYGLKRKFEIFRVLNLMYFKSKMKYKKNREVSQKIFNYKITAFDYGVLIFLFKEIFLSEEYYFVSKNLSPVIIDCGANIGMSVLYFKFLYPDCRIIAFEPNPYVFALLKRNISQNNLKNVELINVALSNSEKSIEFFIGENEGSLVGSILKERGGENVLNIQSGKLSRFIQNKFFDLIKMDIEGAETEVLKDLLTTDKINNSQRYIIEYHHKIGLKKSSISEFIKPFEDFGFEYNLKTSFDQIGAFQNVLLNFYK